MNFFHKNNGSVTVFLSLLLLPVLLFSMLSVDFVKIYGARIITKDACDLTLNTAMANYEQKLYDVYGLLSTSVNTEELSNNLVKYYENTINAMNVEIDENDAYIKSIIKDVKNIISGDSNKNINFNNLIRLNCVEFETSGVKGSEIYNPEVVKRQVIEYMKYRGPACITNNFLQKIKVFKDLPKHQKVLEAKINYDLELADMEKLCKELYELLLDYKKLEKEVVDYNIQFYIDESLEGTDSFFGIKDIVKIIYGIYLNDEIKYTTKINNYCDRDYLDMKSFLEKIIPKIVKDVEYIENSDLSECEKLIDYYYKINNNLDNLLLIEQYEDMLSSKFYDYKQLLIVQHQTLEDIRRKKAKERGEKFIPSENYMLLNAIDEHDNLVSLLNNNKTKLDKYINNLKDKYRVIEDIVEENLVHLNTYMIDKYEKVNNTIKQLNDIINKLNYIKNGKLKNLTELSNQWKRDIDNLSSGQIKDNFNSQYYSSSPIIKKENLEQLLNMCSSNRNKYKLHAKNIEDIKLYNYSLCKKNLSKSIIKKINTLDNIHLNDTYLVTKYCIQKLDKIFIHNYLIDNLASINNVKKTKFYIFLSNMFNFNDSKKVSTYKENTKSQKNLVVNKVYSLFNDCNKEKNNINNNIIPTQGDLYKDLATVILNNINNNKIEDINNVNRDLYIGNNNKTKEFLKNFNTKSSNKVSIINGLAKYFSSKGEVVRDNLYLTEYITNMFSCRTTNLENSMIENSLSGNEFNEKNNYLLNLEQEYILWGKKGDNTNNNLMYTTSAIFGLRYMLNTIYAYSDAEIRAWVLSVAVALAGWTGFGIPVVENVLILVISLGETSLDIYKLTNGEDVVVYKTYNTWHVKPSNIIKDTAIKISKTVVEKCIDDLTNKVEQLTESYSEKKMAELSNTVDEYTELLANEISVSITNSIVMPVYTKIKQSTNCYISGDLDENVMMVNNTNRIYEDLRSRIEGEQSGLVKNVKLMVLDYFIKNELNDLITKIDNKFIQCAKGDNVADVESFVQKIMSEKTHILTEKAKELVFVSGYNKIKQKLKSRICSIKEDFKTNVGKAIDDFYNQIGSSKECFKLENDKMALFCDNYLITLNYKEYIKLFFLCGFVRGNGDEYLARMMDLVKLNISQQNIDDEDFLLRNQYTMVKVSCKTAVKTTFINSRYSKSAVNNNIFYTKCFDIFGY